MNRERKIAKHQPQARTVIAFGFIEVRTNRGARRTLEIAKLLQRDRRVVLAANVDRFVSTAVRRSVMKFARGRRISHLLPIKHGSAADR